MQSYQNVSNSQPTDVKFGHSNGCKRLCKVIKMLAIHNIKVACIVVIEAANAFAKLSKC